MKPTRIGHLYQPDHFGLSIEVFPPKTLKGDASLLRTLEQLSRYQPAFISCTYGAGGSTQSRTIDWCSQIQVLHGITATAHLTCVGSSVQEIDDWLLQAQGAGISNIMALRGDPPEGKDSFQTAEGGFIHANELVALIRRKHPKMGIGVAGYPEKHPEAPDRQTDLDHLKRKVDAGADAVFTQLFYSNKHFFDFRERYEQAEIGVPLVPGIMPITEFDRIKRITSMCGAGIPGELASKLQEARDDKSAQFEIGVEHAIRQCRELVEQQVPGIHFYVLNRPHACERILEALGRDVSRMESG